MRQSGIARLSDLHLDRNAHDYLVMYYLIGDLRDAIAGHAEGDVLDVGCGNKPYESLFEGRIKSYTGCDVVQSDKQRVDVICPATALDFGAERFDTVFSTQVMEHVGDPAQMLKECRRVLRPGGKIILSVPFCWELHEEPFDFFRYSKYGLAALLEQQGLILLDLRANGGKWAAITQMNINMIYSTFRRKGLFRRSLKFLFHHLRLTALLNRLAIRLDRRYHDELLTLNYVVIAKKPVGPA